MITLDHKELTLGTDENNEVKLKFDGIAPQMARLVMEEGQQYRLDDLTQYPGDVLVNDRFIESQLLVSGDRIRLQDGTGRGVTLVYTNPFSRSTEAATTKIYAINASPYLIGRAPDCRIKINSPSVSGHHAQLVEKDGGHTIEDLNSTNGTFVNDVRIRAPRKLVNEDVIRIDRTLLVYKEGRFLLRMPAVQRFAVDAKDLEMTVQTGLMQRRTLNLMRDVNLIIEPQEFVAIIGGSGSGKSTLLRALNGANRATGGQVLMNGIDLYGNYTQYQTMIGYVPQADIVHSSLTVQEALDFAARLRFPNENEDSRADRIKRALEQLQLTDYKDRLVGRLSGGQKKRVSIAIELDEPSSGLDPGLDRSLMETLRRLANRGHIVVVVTHTTLNIGMCDKLALMVRGNLCFYGTPKEALHFFGVRDYTEIYNRVQEAPDGTNLPPDEASKLWADKFKHTPEFKKYVVRSGGQATQKTPVESAYTRGRRGTFGQQARVLIERTLRLALRDLRTMAALMVVLPLVGLFLGLISLDTYEGGQGKMLVDRFENANDFPLFIERMELDPVTSSDGTLPERGVVATGTFTPAADAQRLLFMLSLAVALLGIFASAYTIVEERPLYLRERLTNLKVLPYLTSKVVVYGGITLVSCLLALITFAVGVQIPGQGALLPGFIEMFITMALTGLAGVSIGLLISALSQQGNNVTYLVLAMVFVQILFAGVLFEMDGVLEAPSRLTITRWSLEALGATADMQTREEESHFVVDTVPVRGEQPLLSAPRARQFFRAPSSLSVDYAGDAAGLLGRWLALVLFSTAFLGASALILARAKA
jgi:ABC transport system ATP-binding/permease protein